VAQTYGTHQCDVLRCIASAGANKQFSEEDQRTVTESFRAYLREIGDLAEQEARLLRVELERVGEAMARAMDEGV
jgi:hypothetical protein